MPCTRKYKYINEMYRSAPSQKNINKFMITGYRLRVSIMPIMLKNKQRENIKFNTSHYLLVIYIKQ
jgi:hypothetical protein